MVAPGVGAEDPFPFRIGVGLLHDQRSPGRVAGAKDFRAGARGSRDRAHRDGGPARQRRRCPRLRTRARGGQGGGHRAVSRRNGRIAWRPDDGEKGCVNIAGLPTTWGDPQFKRFMPQEDALVVARLKNAGAVILGKTNVPLMLSDWQTYNDIYGTTNNPWNLRLTPGGSSGGSAAALACGFGPLSIGSDRGGSLRAPAHYCASMRTSRHRVCTRQKARAICREVQRPLGNVGHLPPTWATTTGRVAEWNSYTPAAA